MVRHSRNKIISDCLTTKSTKETRCGTRKILRNTKKALRFQKTSCRHTFVIFVPSWFHGPKKVKVCGNLWFAGKVVGRTDAHLRINRGGSALTDRCPGFAIRTVIARIGISISSPSTVTTNPPVNHLFFLLIGKFYGIHKHQTGAIKPTPGLYNS
jgi:hypothetical protein